MLACDTIDADVLVLVREILVGLGEAGSGVAGAEERRVVAATEVSVLTIDDTD